MATRKSTEDAVRPRKRARVSNDANDVAAASGDKKARGRPRVDTEDATAADVSDVLSRYPYHATFS